MHSFAADPVLSCLLILLGAMVAYALDEIFRFTGIIANWLNGWLDS